MNKSRIQIPMIDNVAFVQLFFKYPLRIEDVVIIRTRNQTVVSAQLEIVAKYAEYFPMCERNIVEDNKFAETVLSIISDKFYPVGILVKFKQVLNQIRELGNEFKELKK